MNIENDHISTILQIIPINNHWNVYMNEATQIEDIIPVVCLALIKIGDKQELKFLDLTEISKEPRDEYLTFLYTKFIPNKKISNE